MEAPSLTPEPEQPEAEEPVVAAETDSEVESVVEEAVPVDLPPPFQGGGDAGGGPDDEARKAAYYEADPHTFNPFSQTSDLDVVHYAIQDINARLKKLEESSSA